MPDWLGDIWTTTNQLARQHAFTVDDTVVRQVLAGQAAASDPGSTGTVPPSNTAADWRVPNIGRPGPLSRPSK